MEIRKFIFGIIITVLLLTLNEKSFSQQVVISPTVVIHEVGREYLFNANYPPGTVQSFEWNASGNEVIGTPLPNVIRIKFGSTGTHIISIGLQILNGTSNYYGGEFAVDVTVPPPPNSLFQTTPYCGSTVVSRQGNPSSQYEWHWQRSVGGPSLGTGASVSISTSGPLYLTSRQILPPYAWGESQYVGNVVVSFQNLLMPSSSGAFVCNTGTARLVAVNDPASTTVKWYAASTGGSPLFTGKIFEPSISTSTTYYATSYNTANQCESTRIPIVAQVFPIPRPGVLSISGNPICSGVTAQLTVTGNIGESKLWIYTRNSDLSLQVVEENVGFNGSITYPLNTPAEWVFKTKAYNLGCGESLEENTTSVWIRPIPQVVIGASSYQVCEGNAITLNATPGTDGDVCRWYTSEQTTSPITVSNNNTTPILFTPRQYWVSSYNTSSGCESGRRLVNVNVNATSLEGPCRLNENYVITNIVQVANIKLKDAVADLPVESRSQTAQYFDGLGRPMQNVSTQASPGKKDIVQPIVYDAFGREARKYLPFVANETNGRYKDNSLLIDATSADYIGMAENFYNNPVGRIANDDNKPYAETIFEPSPLSRVIKQGAPGSAWQPDATASYTSQDHTVKKKYEANTIADNVLLWTYTAPNGASPGGVATAGTSSSPEYYMPNQLYKTSTKDEQHQEVIEFKDKEGHVVLKRVQAPANLWADTYYIYDDYGRLVAVLPPEAVNTLTK